MNDTSLDTGGDSSAGYFSSESRQAATNQSVPLLSTYFADAPTWRLEVESAVGSAEDAELDELKSFVRMRVALAASRRLDTLLRGLEGRTSFQYGLEREESIGAVRGQLDLNRYLRTRLRPEVPRRYPIRVVRRDHATPENILASYGALWALEELQKAPVHLIPATSPEHREVFDRRISLSRLLRKPFLIDATELARQARRQSGLERLLETVETRLQAGKIAATDIYRQLVDWIRRFQPDRVLSQTGHIDWAFYDERFDTKLFEIWSLTCLIASLTKVLGNPARLPIQLLDRGRRAVCTWNLGAGKLHIYFQAGFARAGIGQTKWNFVEPEGSPLGGIPDISAVVEKINGQRLVILIDPKLRERVRAPGEEIYKLLGYFGNLLSSQEPLGAIVFYSPEDPRLYALRGGSGGRVLAIGAEPKNETASQGQFNRIAELILEAAGLSLQAVELMRNAAALSGDEIEEATTNARQEAAVEMMQQLLASLPAGTLDPVRKATAATLFQIWEFLSPETSTMVATAEFFGQNAPSDADHSGPLLGLSAACERLLYETVFDDLLLQHPDLLREGKTLGSLIKMLDDAATRQETNEGSIVAGHLSKNGTGLADVARLIPDLKRLNFGYRIPAAHRELVEQQLWVRGRALILAQSSGLLSQIVSVFGRVDIKSADDEADNPTAE